MRSPSGIVSHGSWSQVADRKTEFRIARELGGGAGRTKRIGVLQPAGSNSRVGRAAPHGGFGIGIRTQARRSAGPRIATVQRSSRSVTSTPAAVRPGRRARRGQWDRPGPGRSIARCRARNNGCGRARRGWARRAGGGSSRSRRRDRGASSMVLGSLRAVGKRAALIQISQPVSDARPAGYCLDLLGAAPVCRQPGWPRASRSRRRAVPSAVGHQHLRESSKLDEIPDSARSKNSGEFSSYSSDMRCAMSCTAARAPPGSGGRLPALSNNGNGEVVALEDRYRRARQDRQLHRSLASTGGRCTRCGRPRRSATVVEQVLEQLVHHRRQLLLVPAQESTRRPRTGYTRRASRCRSVRETRSLFRNAHAEQRASGAGAARCS